MAESMDVPEEFLSSMLKSLDTIILAQKRKLVSHQFHRLIILKCKRIKAMESMIKLLKVQCTIKDAEVVQLKAELERLRKLI